MINIFLKTINDIFLQDYMKKYTTIGLSLPIETATRIDTERGELGRSLYIRKIIERGLSAAVGASNNQTK
jgi:hypothetical protein